MWRVVLSMTACMTWSWMAASEVVSIGWVIIAGIGIIPASIGTMHLVLTEWEQEVMDEVWSERCHRNTVSFNDSKAATKAALQKFLAQDK